MRATAQLPEIALPAGALLIADLHLDPLQPVPWRAFVGWLAALADVPALVVLGDLFEYWTGPGQTRDPAHAELLAALRERSEAGTALHFLHGNRDFLLGRDFERAVGGRVHPLGAVAEVPGGKRVLLLHGDELATQDKSYQRLRTVLRSRPVRGLAGAVPPFVSAAAARTLRRRSRRAVASKSNATVELQRAAAEAWCARTRTTAIVCGHAHRYRDEDLGDGRRWWVLDAFGGPRDLLRVDSDGRLVSGATETGHFQAGTPPLSSRAVMIIALDGPAGVGKSTLARRLARELGLFFLDTGAMYRAVTLAVLRRGLAPEDGEACAELARALELDFDPKGEVRLDGEPGEPAIRGADVTQAVSTVSAHAGVRAAVVARQRAIAEQHSGLVAEGRDTTTVVFPEATHKFFLEASPKERALRRARQEGALDRLEAIQADLERRDRHDSSRKHAPLRAAPDARRIDTEGLGPDEVLARLLAHVREEVG